MFCEVHVLDRVVSRHLLFNMLYKDLVDLLSNTSGGICIDRLSFNVFCYADDLLVTRLTVSGLQNLIYVANRYIIMYGTRPSDLC